MAQHRTPKSRNTIKALTAVITAVLTITGGGMLSSGYTDLSDHAAVRALMLELTNSVIGTGGKDDTTSVRLQDKLNGSVVPAGYHFEAIPYPASIDFAHSRDVGVPLVRTALVNRAGEEFLVVTGYSEGSLVTEQVRRQLNALPVESAPSNGQVSFVMIASPFVGNGGLLARFPGLSIPGVIDPMGASVPTRYDTTYYVNEYDPVGDFPAYFNPLSIANSLIAFFYQHPDSAYDPVDPTTAPRVTRVVEDNGAGGTDTYVMFLAPHLPLFAPIRDLAQSLSLTPIVEPLLGAIEPLVRLAVDAGYTDRTYAHPETPTPFSLVTPPRKIIEALAGVPAALEEGLANLASGGRSTPATVDTETAPEASPKTTDTATTAPPTAGAAAEATAEAPPAAEPEPEPVARKRVTRPTVTSLGNKVAPTTLAGDTPRPRPLSVVASESASNGTGNAAPNTAPNTEPEPAPEAGTQSNSPADTGAPSTTPKLREKGGAHDAAA